MSYLIVQRDELPVHAAARLNRVLLRLFGLPRRGRNVGDGRHVELPDTCPNPPPRELPGWTTRVLELVRHPSNNGSGTDRWAIEVTDALRAQWLARRHRLTQAERDWIASKFSGAAALPADWYIEGELSREDVDPEA